MKKGNVAWPYIVGLIIGLILLIILIYMATKTHQESTSVIEKVGQFFR